MGRDIFDAAFLFGKVQPDYEYLRLKTSISNMTEIKKQLLAKCETLRLENLAKDLEPFLIKPSDAKRVLLFGDYIKKL